MTAVYQQVSPRPRAYRRVIREPREGLITHENQQVDIAPVVRLATAQGADHSHSIDSRIGSQQPKHVIKQGVTKLSQKGRSGCHPSDSSRDEPRTYQVAALREPPADLRQR
jgi:hypothetical protein